MDAPPRYPHYMAHHPCRTPDWRWQRAQWLVDREMYCTWQRDDIPTCQAVRYLRALRRCRGGRPSRRLLSV
jgi:hypothetical protein